MNQAGVAGFASYDPTVLGGGLTIVWLTDAGLMQLSLGNRPGLLTDKGRPEYFFGLVAVLGQWAGLIAREWELWHGTKAYGRILGVGSPSDAHGEAEAVPGETDAPTDDDVDLVTELRRMVSEEAPELRAVARRARRLRVADENRDALENLLARTFRHDAGCGTPGCRNRITQVQTFGDAWDILQAEFPEHHELLLGTFWNMLWWMAEGYPTRTAELLAGPSGDVAVTKASLGLLQARGYAHEYTAEEIDADPMPIDAPPGWAPFFDCTEHQLARRTERPSTRA
jgi:hypothetical protein